MAKPVSSRVVMASREAGQDDVDFFPTAPWGARAGGDLILRLDPRARSAWECACGPGLMAHGLKDYFPTLFASDAYPYNGNAIHDFLGAAEPPVRPDWVVTNPPFVDGKAEAFIRRAYQIATRGVAMLLRVGMLESGGRYPLLMAECPLTVFAPFSERLPIVKGRWEPDASSAAFYAWFIWLKPVARPARFMTRFEGTYHPTTILIPPGSEARFTHPSDARLFGAKDRSRLLVIAEKGLKVGKGVFLTPAKWRALTALAACQRGSAAVQGVMEGGDLAALVQFELAIRLPEDRLGGNRYAVSEAGGDLLASLGWVG